MTDLALLLLRLVTGGLLAGHGAQKGFGVFGGPGLEGMAGWLESLGLRPGKVWARVAVLGELGGGLLTAVGLASPLGPVLAASAMGTAWGTAHLGKPIWATTGGAELPLTNISVATALALAGPRRYSLDRVFGIRVPGWITAIAVLAGIAGVAVGYFAQPPAAEGEAEA